MDVRKIILAVLAASAVVLSERVDSADADYCFDFREGKLALLLVKQKNIDVQTTGMKDPIDCGGYYESVETVIDFIDKSGKRIVSLTGYSAGIHMHSACYFGPDAVIERTYEVVPTTICIELPPTNTPGLMFDGRIADVSEESLQFKYIADVSKELLQFKGKVIDGHIKIESECQPYYENKHEIKFRAKITGECAADFLKKYDRSLRR